jgi:hypothetical protein
MPTIKYTDETRLDLSDEPEFAGAIERREELDEMIETFRDMLRERKEIDAKIIERLGNAKSALAANGDIVSVRTVERKAYTVPPGSYKIVKVRHPPKSRYLRAVT